MNHFSLLASSQDTMAVKQKLQVQELSSLHKTMIMSQQNFHCDRTSQKFIGEVSHCLKIECKYLINSLTMIVCICLFYPDISAQKYVDHRFCVFHCKIQIRQRQLRMTCIVQNVCLIHLIQWPSFEMVVHSVSAQLKP